MIMTGQRLYPSLSPVASIKVAITDSLRDMVRLHALGMVEVGNGACHLEDAVLGSCREFEPLHAKTEELQ